MHMDVQSSIMTLNLCELARKAVSGWLAAQTQQTSQSYQHLQVLVEEGQQAQTHLCQYVDWLVTTVNDALPSTTDRIYPSPILALSPTWTSAKKTLNLITST